MSDKFILNDASEPVPCDDLLTWGKWMESRDARRVGADTIGDVRVSTVFLGLDHSFGDGPPLLYETMIFGGEHDQWQERYSTRDEALAGHLAAVVKVRGQ